MMQLLVNIVMDMTAHRDINVCQVLATKMVNVKFVTMVTKVNSVMDLAAQLIQIVHQEIVSIIYANNAAVLRVANSVMVMDVQMMEIVCLVLAKKVIANSVGIVPNPNLLSIVTSIPAVLIKIVSQILVLEEYVNHVIIQFSEVIIYSVTPTSVLQKKTTQHKLVT